MGIPASEFIRPLKVAENHFLQVLLSKFLLNRSGGGASLEVEFDEETPAIWSRLGKRALLDGIPEFAKKAKL